jgi:hypothetical protein
MGILLIYASFLRLPVQILRFNSRICVKSASDEVLCTASRAAGEGGQTLRTLLARRKRIPLVDCRFATDFNVQRSNSKTAEKRFAPPR